MSTDNEKELAYRYDLFVAPDWEERFDTLAGENVEIPVEGVALEVNCGTGASAVELAGLVKDKGGEVIGVDPSDARLELARARASVLKLDNIAFQTANGTDLPFEEDRFDTVIGDGSLLGPAQIEATLVEMLRVARPGATVVLKITTRGSFDEFFSVYWEALHDCQLDEQAWERLELMINERLTVSAAEEMAARAGLRNVNGVTSKEEFSYESGADFLDAPLIADNFLSEWLSIVPKEDRAEVKRRISEVIDRERHDGPFDLSIKATLISGSK